MLDAIAPLGLFSTRMRAVVAVSQRFLEMPVFDIGLTKELKVYGVGEFGYHSYLIFCRGQGRTLKPNDSNLQGYCRWLRENSQPGPDE